MTPKQFLENYLQLLWDLLSYDVETMSQPWMYWWLCIPAFLYFIFMCFKWCFLMSPVLLPFRVVRQVLKSTAKALRDDKK